MPANCGNSSLPELCLERTVCNPITHHLAGVDSLHGPDRLRSSGTSTMSNVPVDALTGLANLDIPNPIR